MDFATRLAFSPDDAVLAVGLAHRPSLWDPGALAAPLVRAGAIERDWFFRFALDLGLLVPEDPQHAPPARGP